MRILLCLILLLLAHDAAAFSGSYHIVVDEEGRAAVFVGLNGSSAVDVPLPVDVSKPTVLNAIYVDSPDGVEVSVKGNDPATLVYQTSTIAVRTPYGWVLDMGFGNRTYSALVSIPSRATVKLTKPDARVFDDGGSKNIIWESTDHIRVLYDYIPVPPQRETTTTSVLPQSGQGGIPAPSTPVLAGAVIIAAAAYILYGRRGK